MKILTSKKQNEILLKLWELRKATYKLPLDEFIKVGAIIPDIAYELCGLKGERFMSECIDKFAKDEVKE